MTRNQSTSQKSTKSTGNQTSGQTQHHHHFGHHRKIVHFEPFDLLSHDDKSLKIAAELVESASLNRFRVCVVSIISKDSIDDSMKNHLVDSLLNSNTNHKRKQIIKNSGKVVEASAQQAQDNEIKDDISRVNQKYENQVVGHVDCKADVIVLNLTSFLETEKLNQLIESVDGLLDLEGGESQSMLTTTWPRWNQNLIKTMLILFVMSHIVVFYSPDPSMDYNLIQTFKILETLRLKSQNRITDLLETIASKQMFPQQWIRQGRVSCPRALFICSALNLDISISHNDIYLLKRDLEDQIYKMLKKTNVTYRSTSSSSVSSQQQQSTLLSLPERDDFVFIITHKDFQSSDTNQPLANNPILKQEDDFYSKLLKSIYSTTKSDTSENNAMHEPSSHHNQIPTSTANEDDHSLLEESDVKNTETQISLSTPVAKTSQTHQNRLKKFLARHITEIQATSQPDSTNKHHTGKQTNPILPRYDDFFTVLLRLKCLMFPTQELSEKDSKKDESDIDDWQVPDERRFVDIYDLYNTDELFSKHYCNKTRLAAFDFYKRGMQVPNKTAHENSRDSARRLYLNHARGSSCSTNLDLLIDQCNQYWQSLNQSDSTKDVKDNRHYNGNRVSRAKSSDVVISSNDGPTNPGSSSVSLQTKSGLTIARKANGIKMLTFCDCGRQTNYFITPVDRKKKLERVDIHRVND